MSMYDAVLSACYGGFRDGVNRVTISVLNDGWIYGVVYNVDGSLYGVYVDNFEFIDVYPVDILEDAEIPMRDFLAKLREEGYVS